MQLRDRKTTALRSSVKQEDCKPALINARPSTVIAMSSNTFDLTIKQEDTKEHKASLLQQNDEFGSKDHYYRCDTCHQRLPTLKSVLKHRKEFHFGRRDRNTKIKNIDEEPHIHDPNFYCKSCEKSYVKNAAYRNHLRNVHYMVLKPIPRSTAPKNDITPDPDDPNLYCRACDFTYKCKMYYKDHCRFAHGLNPAKFAHWKSTSSSTADSYCHACDKRFASMGTYRRHLLRVHNIVSRRIQQKQNDIVPNVNDPNFYCRSCERKLAGKTSFRKHLKLVHSIFKKAPKKSSLTPDVNDPNNHCRACQRAFSAKRGYRSHLRLVHQMTLPVVKSNVICNQYPDPDKNPHFYPGV